MKIDSINHWDDTFFKRFIDLKNQLFQHDSSVFNESLKDMAVYFSPESPITREYNWMAFLVSENGVDLARGVLSFKRNSKIGQLGFLEFVENQYAFHLLMKSMESEANRHQLLELRGPTNINFFISYRWKLPNGGEPFYSEPVVPAYYHDFIQSEGYFVSESWDTFEVDFKKSIRQWGEKQKALESKRSENYLKIKLRCIRPWDFKNEIKIIHKLFVESYKQMGEYDEIDLESFTLLYKDFKYLINPFFSYIAYYKNEPVGFVLNIFDSLPILREFSKRPPTKLERIKLLLKLQLNRSRLLIMYSGRIPTASGEEIKGLQIKVSKRLIVTMLIFRVKSLFVCFQSSSSPSKRSFDDNAQRPYSKYVMYRKHLK